jgi:hypothetical protein
MLKKGPGQVFDFLAASHEQQADKKIELYGCDKYWDGKRRKGS